MNKINPQEDVHFTFPKDENGDVSTKYRCMVALGKRLSEVQAKLQEVVGTMEGVDGYEIVGMYTFQMAIAPNFDAEEVLEEFANRLRARVLSDIIAPPAIIS